MAEFSRTGMRSVRTACPEGVVKRVCRTFELAMYSRVTEYGAEGEILQRPPRSRSSIAAKLEDESNRGQQGHATEPLFATRAAERQSPMLPLSSTAGTRPAYSSVVACDCLKVIGGNSGRYRTNACQYI